MIPLSRAVLCANDHISDTSGTECPCGSKPLVLLANVLGGSVQSGGSGEPPESMARVLLPDDPYKLAALQRLVLGA